MGHGIRLRSHATADDAYVVFDKAADRIEKQLRRYKNRLSRHQNSHRISPSPVESAPIYILEREGEDVAVPDVFDPVIIAEESTDIPTLTAGAGEAVSQSGPRWLEHGISAHGRKHRLDRPSKCPSVPSKTPHSLNGNTERMELADLLSPDSVICNLRAASKKLVLQDLARRAAVATGLSERAIFDTLLEREKLGSTAVGHGIAIPHGKFTGLDRLYGLIAKLEQPIDFDSADDRPVDLVFLLLAPEAAGADHLKALAKVSRLLRDKGVCERLRHTKSSSSLYDLVTKPQPANHN